MEKVAIIELNEVGVKLSFFKVSDGKSQLCLTKEQYFPVGKEIESEELLSPKTKTDILNILKIYRKMIESFGTSKIVSFADNVFTKARNYKGFLDEIYNNTGLNFTILSDEECMKSLFSSVVASIDNAKGVFLYIGAYTSYLVKYNRRVILGSVAIPVGRNNVASDGESMDSVAKTFKKVVVESGALDLIEEECKVVCVGKAFVSLGKIAKKISRYPLDIDNNYTISLETIGETYDFIKSLDREKIRKIKGVGNDDADQIANGVAMIKSAVEAIRANEITISTANVRDGQLAQNMIVSQERFNDLLANSLDNWYEFSKDEFSINDDVYNMSLILFKQLKVMHKLPRYYVKPLRIAAFMYDAGKCINAEEYTKYSVDKIVYSGIAGATHRELLIAGFIALCQNLDDFSLNEWIKYKDIVTEEDLDAVRKLGVIVKLAVALNASRKPVIQDIVCDILGDSIIMKTVAETDVTLEIIEGMKVAQDYRKVYKKSLQII